MDDGTTIVDAGPKADEETAPLDVLITTRAGERPADNVFDHPADVFMQTLAGAPGDYYFRVLDRGGNDISGDSIECRRVAIDSAGVIEGLVGDPACARVTGDAMVGLAPFGRSTALDGYFIYQLQVAPAAGFTEFLPASDDPTRTWFGVRPQ